jgi:hypothetical protein
MIGSVSEEVITNTSNRFDGPLRHSRASLQANEPDHDDTRGRSSHAECRSPWFALGHRLAGNSG